jgi:hypothetical protein
MVWVYSSRLHMLKFNFHCEVLRGWKFHLIMVFRGGAFGRWLRIDKVIRVEPPWLNPGDFKRKGEKPEETHMPQACTHSLLPYHLGILSVRSPSPDVATLSWTSRTMSQSKALFFIIYTVWNIVISNRKQINIPLTVPHQLLSYLVLLTAL